MHGSVLHAMSRVGLGAAWRQGSEQGLEAEFEIARGHDAVDGALAELGGQGEDCGGGLAGSVSFRACSEQYSRAAEPPVQAASRIPSAMAVRRM